MTLKKHFPQHFITKSFKWIEKYTVNTNPPPRFCSICFIMYLCLCVHPSVNSSALLGFSNEFQKKLQNSVLLTPTLQHGHYYLELNIC